MGEKVKCKVTLLGINDIELYTEDQDYEVRYMAREVIVRDNFKCLRPFHDMKFFSKYFERTEADGADVEGAAGE